MPMAVKNWNRYFMIEKLKGGRLSPHEDYALKVRLM
jgi:hypothetical protein